MTDCLESWIEDLTERQVGETYIDKLVRVDYTACELMRQYILSNPASDQTQFARLMMLLFHKFASDPERSKVCYDPNLIIEGSLISTYSKDISHKKVDIGDYPIFHHCIEYYVAVDILELDSKATSVNTYLQTTVVRKKLREAMSKFCTKPLEANESPF